MRDVGSTPREIDGRAPGRKPVVTYLIGSYPLLTTTFIDREIEALRRQGISVSVLSLRRPHGRLSTEQTARLGEVEYLLPVGPVALLRSHLRFMATRPGAYWGTLRWLLGRPHPGFRSRLKTILHFGEGVHVAHLIRRTDAEWLHAHFIDRAAIVAMVAGRLLDLPYSVTAHANDIYVDPVLLPEKLEGAAFVATCTDYNAAHLAAVGGPAASEKVVTIHHGINLDRYQPRQGARDPVPTILAVGQLKEKKGFRYLIDACRLLVDRGYRFRCKIVGDGPLRAELEEHIRGAALEDVVALLGSLDHGSVIEWYEASEIFTLPCVTGEDGDRDGIPNVILEAMAMELPVATTRHSGIPEVIEDGWNGLLVRPGDADDLAVALARLLDDPAERGLMGSRGRKTVAEKFDADVNATKLMSRLITGIAGNAKNRVVARGEPLFLVWGPPSYGPRSRALAGALAIDVQYVTSIRRRGLLVAPLKYAHQALSTVVLLARRRPSLVFVQSPPSPAAMLVAAYGAITSTPFVIDAHSAAMQSSWWTKPRWLHRMVARSAVTTIVTNDHFAARLRGMGADALVVRDIPTSFPTQDEVEVGPGFNVVVVNTFSFDEPLDEVMAAAAELDDVTFHVTGDPRRARQPLPEPTPPNVRFTGFLPDAQYYGLLNAAHTVMCLTTRDHTMQRGACEALSLGRPIITSDWPLLRGYFHQGTVHVDNSADGIRSGVMEMMQGYDKYAEGIGALQVEQHREWQEAFNALVAQIEPSLADRKVV